MTEKRGMKALELWCRRVTDGYPGVKIENMTTSWRDGLAFCALIHHFRPDLIDFDRLDKSDIYKNNELAFRIAERQLGIPALLDAEDMVEYEVPDRLSILTYLSQFYQAFVSNQQATTNSPARTHPSKVAEMISPTTKTAKPSKVSSGRLETCWSCRRPVFLAERLVAGGKLRHRTCFTCKRCGNQLNLVGYYETETGDFVCETCPDEEKRGSVVIEGKGEEVPLSGDTRMSAGYPKDEYSLDFEKALDASVEKGDRNTNEKDTVDSQSEETCPASHVEQKMLEKMKTGLPPECTDNNQHNTANLEALNIKIKSLLGRDFTETLSLLNHEPESFIADISEIIDNVISDAVTEVEIRRGGGTEKSDLPHAEEIAEIKLNDKSFVAVNDTDSTTAEEDNSVSLITEDVPADDTVQVETVEVSEKDSDEKVVHDTSEVVENKQDDYPEDLNPFADDDDEEETPNKQTETQVTPKKQPPVTPRRLVPNKKAVDKGQNPNLNPFWSDGEPESEDEGIKPVPAPRTSLRSSEEDPSRLHYGSFTSLNSMGSTVSRRKKGPAPAPPSGHKSLQYPASPQSNKSMSPMYRSPSPSMSIRSHRKSKPAPPPPPVNVYRSEESDVLSGKKEKNYENKVKQNLSVPDKSSYGKWKRKKSQAPSLPIPQRRRIAPLPLPEFYRELEDLEIQQRELERQGVNLEQTIRMYDEESPDVLEGGDTTAKDIEGLILQLFEIVNQKNELFRRQAELMYLRRQQRLEEEHADIEYQIRCLMGRPERNKTDSDKEQEEELIRRLVEVVERRNEIIECLDMDRRREVEEDKSIHHHLEAFAGKRETDSESPEKKSKTSLKSSPSLLKFVKKKKSKKEKEKQKEPAKNQTDFDKDVDESLKEEVVKPHKAKKKWY